MEHLEARKKKPKCFPQELLESYNIMRTLDSHSSVGLKQLLLNTRNLECDDLPKFRLSFLSTFPQEISVNAGLSVVIV